MRRLVAAPLLLTLIVTALVTASSAGASSSLQKGMYDEATTLFSASTGGFDTLAGLGVDVLRLNLYWNRVAAKRPADAADPADPAYDWSLYDRALRLAQERGIEVLLSVYGTPGWANGGKGQNYAPSNAGALQAFSRAAARRYSGNYAALPGDALPRVDRWMAWNEPNSPTFLKPQFTKAGKGYVVASAGIYAKLCNAVVDGVHAAGNAAGVSEKVACGATNPRGNNSGRGSRPSVSPLVFLRKMKAAGARPDVISHHPYAVSRFESPTTRPDARTTVTLANIGDLIAEVNRLWGEQKRIWITEYGYQTNPPDKLFGVTPKAQAAYLTQAYGIARSNPRIDLMCWFLLRDEKSVSRWQSGLMTAGGARKPSFAAYKKIL